MKSRRRQKSLRSAPPGTVEQGGVSFRHCHGIEEFEGCVRLEREVWKSADIDVVPIPLFVVAAETGGQVLGAFHGNDLVGFTMAIAGWRNRTTFLHSHMTAVSAAHRDRGIGRQLKLFQRADALARGISLIEWTFDPLVTKNAYFNSGCHSPAIRPQRLRNHDQPASWNAPHRPFSCGMALALPARSPRPGREASNARVWEKSRSDFYPGGNGRPENDRPLPSRESAV